MNALSSRSSVFVTHSPRPTGIRRASSAGCCRVQVGATRWHRWRGRNAESCQRPPVVNFQVKHSLQPLRYPPIGKRACHWRVRPLPSDNATAAPVLNARLTEAVTDLLAEWRHTDDLARLRTRPNIGVSSTGRPESARPGLHDTLPARLGLPLYRSKARRPDVIVLRRISSTRFGTLFDFANRYRCLLLLDEFDAVAKARDDAREIGEIKRVVNTLLQSLDSRNGIGITVAATNHEHMLDSAYRWRRSIRASLFRNPTRRPESSSSGSSVGLSLSHPRTSGSLSGRART